MRGVMAACGVGRDEDRAVVERAPRTNQAQSKARKLTLLTNQIMRAALYFQVSTDEQKERASIRNPGASSPPNTVRFRRLQLLLPTAMTESRAPFPLRTAWWVQTAHGRPGKEVRHHTRLQVRPPRSVHAGDSQSRRDTRAVGRFDQVHDGAF